MIFVFLDEGYVTLKRPNELSCLTTPNRQALKEDTRLVSVILYGTDFRAYEAPLPRLRNHLVSHKVDAELRTYMSASIHSG